MQTFKVLSKYEGDEEDLSLDLQQFHVELDEVFTIHVQSDEITRSFQVSGKKLVELLTK